MDDGGRFHGGTDKLDDHGTVRVDIGSRRLTVSALGLACVLAFEALAVRALVTGSDAASGFSHVILWGITILLALLLPLSLFGVIVAVRERGTRIAVGRQGVWWQGRRTRAVPWEDLLAVGLATVRHPAAKGMDSYRHHLELFPRQAPDPGDPVLGGFVRHADPPRPGLPRYHWKIELGGVPSWSPEPREGSAPQRLAAAVRAHRPDLWSGVTRLHHGAPGTKRIPPGPRRV